MQMKNKLPAGLILAKDAPPAPKKGKGRPKKKTPQERGRHARRKGHGFEREVAKMFREHGFLQARRNLEYQAGLGVDIDGTGIYDAQLKRGKFYANPSLIKEVPYKEGRVPLLITKADGQGVLVVMPMEHFLEIMKK